MTTTTLTVTATTGQAAEPREHRSIVGHFRALLKRAQYLTWTLGQPGGDRKWRFSAERDAIDWVVAQLAARHPKAASEARRDLDRYAEKNRQDFEAAQARRAGAAK